MTDTNLNRPVRHKDQHQTRMIQISSERVREKGKESECNSGLEIERFSSISSIVRSFAFTLITNAHINENWMTMSCCRWAFTANTISWTRDWTFIMRQTLGPNHFNTNLTSWLCYFTSIDYIQSLSLESYHRNLLAVYRAYYSKLYVMQSRNCRWPKLY